MSYEVKKGNVFGRIGSELGKGLAEQIPKETERYRLAEGLKELGNKKGLSRFQKFSELASLPGSTPQIIQSGTDLLNQEARAEAYANTRKPTERGSFETERNQENRPSVKDVNFADLNKGGYKTPKYETGEPQIINENPTNPEFLPVAPWSPERRDEEITNQINKGHTPEKAEQIAADNEARDLAQAPARQARYDYVKGKRDELRNEFTKSLELKLQKEGKDVFGDATGEYISNMLKGMERDLVENPKATIPQIVDDWTSRALDLAKTKSELKTKSDTSTWALPILLGGDKYSNELKNASKIFANTGNSEEYYNLLQSDFNMSPQGAATLAYERSKPVKEYVSSLKPSKLNDFESHRSNARKYALDIEKKITADDSILAIARDLREKDPYFDQHLFMDQIGEDWRNGKLALTPFQQRELKTGVQITPNWSDLLILPAFRRL